MSDSPAPLKTCPQCGVALPSDATEGLCPRCLMNEAMHSEDSNLDGLASVVPTAFMAEPAVSGPRPAEIEFPLPEELANLLPKGAFHIEGFLAQGGMGAVYQGTQVRLKRRVAIKIMRRDQGRDHDFERRFEHEAQAMARLNHPNIVSVIDFGEAGPNYLYIVMEFVEGADLMDVIRTQRMTQEMALLLLPQICDALQFAHDHGIVHRDIKPSNIMLTRDGHIKMADFGLAKRFDAESNLHTKTGTGMGTPDYAAPEQFNDNSPVDHRADIYALGVMIYQMITGTLPRGVWKPPSQRAEVDPQWDDIVSHAMQSDPKDRYQQASHIKSDVSRITPKAPLPSSDEGDKAKTTASNREANAPAPVAPTPPRRSRAFAFFSYSLGILALVVGAFWAIKKPEGKPARVDPASPDQAVSPPLPTPDMAGGAPTPQAATKDAPFINSLGMKFVPVPITSGPTKWKKVLFSVWDTRVQDYQAFVTETKRAWQKIEIEQGPTHPAVRVNWDDAQAFCAWLTERDRKAGRLGANERYRLPSDHEWSCAVGIGGQEDPAKSPQEKNLAIPDVYPWGKQWPPPDRTANFASEELRPLLAAGKHGGALDGLVKDYHDGYAETSPVESYAPNQLGLCDMAGNVWQWCEDWWNAEHKGRVLRGGCWAGGAQYVLSSARTQRDPGETNISDGFRCVLDASAASGANTPQSATKAAPFVNSFGMKFVPVPIKGGPTDKQRVLFSIWDTRVQDYDVFVRETNRGWPAPPFEQGPTHPAVMVSWEDAQAFCVWLTERERRADKLSEKESYRLPSDHEWSCAVGIGDKEDAALLPAEKKGRIYGIFPWGTTWPPPENTVNLASEELRPMLEQGKLTVPDAASNGVMKGYHDGYAFTSPVESYPPNALGLYDMGGNVQQWCEDWNDADKKSRTLRGSSWTMQNPSFQFSSNRPFGASTGHYMWRGFRVVLVGAPSAPAGAVAPAAATKDAP